MNAILARSSGKSFSLAKLRSTIFLGSIFLSIARPGVAASLFSVTPGNNRINELNADTGALINSFVPPIVAQSAGGSGLAYSGSELFFSDIQSATIYRLNPANGAVLGSFVHPGGAIDALGYGPTSFGPTLLALDYSAHRLYLLNPASGATFNSYVLSFEAVGGIDYNWKTGRLFVSDGSGVIRQIDPASGIVFSSFSTGAFQTGVGLVGSRLFTCPQSSDSISERDPLTGAVIRSFLSPGGFAGGLAGGPVPEPAAAALVAGGITSAGVLFGRRGRRRVQGASGVTARAARRNP